MKNIVQNMVISSAITPTVGAAGQTLLEGSIIDMSSFNAVLAHIRLGAIVATGTIELKLEHGDASDLADAADVKDSAVDIVAADAEEIVDIDMVVPTKRYVRLVATRAVANSTLTAEYIQYNSTLAEVTQPAGTNINLLNAGISGTA